MFGEDVCLLRMQGLPTFRMVLVEILLVVLIRLVDDAQHRGGCSACMVVTGARDQKHVWRPVAP